MVRQLPAQAVEPRYRVSLLGPFAVYRDGVPLDTDTWQRNVSALLKLLATAPQWRRSRDEIIEILWPDASPHAGGSNLRSQLHLLRRSLAGGDPSPVLFERGWLELNRAFTWEIDLVQFEELLRRVEPELSVLQDALALYRGEPLPDERYDDWAQPVRERVQRLWRDSVLQIAQMLEEQGEHDEVRQALEWLLEHDPLDEEALRPLLRVLAVMGRRAEALRRYQQFAHRLREEMELEPDATTRAVVDQIRAHLGPSTDERKVESASLSSRPVRVVLPAALTSFVGRDEEIAAIQRTLRRPEVRLLTLSGTAGTGKTRLAIEVARSVQASFSDGVFFVRLAPVAEGALVPSTISGVMGIQDWGSTWTWPLLAHHLRDRRMLLVLDNLEHLPTAARGIAELLETSPGLNILVTSRAVLHIYGEHEFPVPSLGVPESGRTLDIERLLELASVRLFVTRAQATLPGFTLTAANAGAIAGICTQLEGLPLSLELAAALSKTFQPQSLLQQLSNRLGLLAHGPINRTDRQQSLRGAIDWSYVLLTEEEQGLLARLSVFVGGCTVEAAQAVCASIAQPDVLGGLISLVDKSLLQQLGEEEPRFVLLETIREYAAEKLVESGKSEQLSARHAAYVLRMSEEAEQALAGPDQAHWFRRLDAEVNNVRAALQWLLDVGPVEDELRLVAALEKFWQTRGYVNEESRWLEDGLARRHEVSPEPLAKALWTQGRAFWLQGDHARATASLEDALLLYRDLGDQRGVARTLNLLGNEMTELDRIDEASHLYRQSLQLWTDLGDRHEAARPLQNLGNAMRLQGDLVTGRRLIEEAIAINSAAQDTRAFAFGLSLLGTLEIQENNRPAAEERWSESLKLFRTLGGKREIAELLGAMAMVYREQDRLQSARAFMREALLLTRELTQGIAWAMTLQEAVFLAVAEGKHEFAVEIQSVVVAYEEELKMVLPAADLLEREELLAPARESLDDETFTRAWERGRAMSLEQAVSYVLDEYSHETSQ
jgi:predicted ATPase/DNA-binding SARP family transcriptional activator